ncbi:hypothetical protein AX14_010327, partial [Amanita brunnescens Koide BX004]
MTGVAGNTDVLYSHLHLSRPSQNASPVQTIVWSSKLLDLHSHHATDPKLLVKVNDKKYLVQNLLGDEKPALDLY